MTVAIVRMNGVIIQDNRETLKDRLIKEIAKTEETINSKNRETRRSKPMREVVGVFGLFSTLALTAIDKAYASDSSLASAYLDPQKGIGSVVMDKLKEKAIDSVTPEFVRNDTLLWKLNEYMSDTLMKTHDFFSNPSIVGMFTTISYITMSFLTLIIAKKGFNMIKAKLMGASTMGAPELIVRILASFIMTFLSLKVASIGIGLSNGVIKAFMSSISSSVLPQVAIENQLGAALWLVSYILMFAILMVRYWVRQIEIVLLGLITPVANMSWVVDGGQMLGTVIKEMTVCLTTPIAQGFILSIGTVILTEVAGTFGGMMGFFSQIFIGLSTLFLMIVQPEFLRKFIHGSANPLKWAMDTALRMKAMPMKFKSALK